MLRRLQTQELRASRAQKVESLAALADKMNAEEYVESDVETELYDELKKKIGELDKKIARAGRVACRHKPRLPSAG